MDFMKLAARERAYIEECRHYMHRHPERSHQEEKTAAFIAGELRSMGLDPQENVGGYGVTAVIKGRSGGRCVGLRADFDALPVQEKTGCAFASETDGLMHACGHDCHAAMLLGAAKVLVSIRDSFSGQVKLIFQPAEEDAADSGAKRMIEAGCLKDPDVEIIYGQHVWPRVRKGCVGIRKGAVSAASDRFFIDIKGKASHAGAAPEKGIDAVVIAAETVNALETIVSRNVSALDAAVISIGLLQAGQRYNIVADNAHMEGTCRTFNPEVRRMIAERMRFIVEHTAAPLGGEGTLDYTPGFSSVWNPEETVDTALPVLNELFAKENIIFEADADLSGEDFCFYGEHVPACYFHLGCREEGVMTAQLHQGSFLPSDGILVPGAALLTALAVRYLEKP